MVSYVNFTSIKITPLHTVRTEGPACQLQRDCLTTASREGSTCPQTLRLRPWWPSEAALQTFWEGSFTLESGYFQVDPLTL
jgi:hypothetical protein